MVEGGEMEAKPRSLEDALAGIEGGAEEGSNIPPRDHDDHDDHEGQDDEHDYDDDDEEDDEEDSAALEREAGLVISAGAMLAAHLVENMTSLFNAGICDVVLGIPFVPAALGLPGEPSGPGATGCNVLTSYSQALLPGDWKMGFMSTPVISPDFVPPTFARSSLRLRSPPTLAAIVSHLKEGRFTPLHSLAVLSPPLKAAATDRDERVVHA